MIPCFRRRLITPVVNQYTTSCAAIPVHHSPRHLRYSSSSSRDDTLDELLSTPSWSVRSLLPSSETAIKAPEVTSKQLHHLLRLSALPPPSSPAEETKMLQTLQSQLHFVQDIQSVDTTSVDPLRSIRDETPEAEAENEITMEKLKGAFDKEEVRGPSKRIRRKKGLTVDTKGAEDWDVLGLASRKVGRYFVVESKKEE
ncbi:MAG: hypothetical protein M1817_002597 [Caeruleum heppii]|nr:MAG: hypothetical protein M1817_002597 [Caeruleum heppii]